jgi:hypothetical protein
MQGVLASLGSQCDQRRSGGVNDVRTGGCGAHFPIVPVVSGGHSRDPGAEDARRRSCATPSSRPSLVQNSASRRWQDITGRGNGRVVRHRHQAQRHTLSFLPINVRKSTVVLISTANDARRVIKYHRSMGQLWVWELEVHCSNAAQ